MVQDDAGDVAGAKVVVRMKSVERKRKRRSHREEEEVGSGRYRKERRKGASPQPDRGVCRDVVLHCRYRCAVSAPVPYGSNTVPRGPWDLGAIVLGSRAAVTPRC